jgi:RNA recognition motif-containing protein
MNLHVTNLSIQIIESDLEKLFSVYGQVTYVVIVRDKKTGQSRGHAFVEMPMQAQGEQAIFALHHSMLDGIRINVREIEYRAGEFNN